MTRSMVVAVLLLVLFSCATALAQVPQVLGYHGRIKDKSTGKPVSGFQVFVFSIHGTPTGGTTPLWTESQNIHVDSDGFFDATLGNTTKFPAGLMGTKLLYLQIKVGSQLMSPRQQILSMPFSLRAAAGGTRNIDGNADLDKDTSETALLRFDTPPRRVTLQLVGYEFSRFHYTVLPQHTHSASAATTTPSCSAAGGHNHRVKGTTASSGVTVNSVGTHGHSCSGGNTSYSNPKHSHAIRGYSGGSGCPSWAGSCPGTGYYQSGHSLALITDTGVIGGVNKYGLVPVSNNQSTPRDYYTSDSSINHRHTYSCGIGKGGNHSHSTKSHSHSMDFTSYSTGHHNHSCKAHGHTVTVANAGDKSGYSMTSAVLAYPDRIKLYIDGQDCTTDATNQANTNWGTTGKSLGDGTASNPLVAGANSHTGTGPLDITKFANCMIAITKKGVHSHKLTHPQAGGGRLRYNVIVEY